ncbi:hypothetical protein GCM10017691_20350 [Pseudonocardia petroleophila]
MPARRRAGPSRATSRPVSRAGSVGRVDAGDTGRVEQPPCRRAEQRELDIGYLEELAIQCRGAWQQRQRHGRPVAGPALPDPVSPRAARCPTSSPPLYATSHNLALAAA